MRPVVEFFSWTELHAIASAYTKDITQQLPVPVYQASLPRLKLNTAIPDCWKRLLFSLTALLKGKKVTNKQNKTEPTSYCWKWLNVEVNGIEMWDLSKGKKNIWRKVFCVTGLEHDGGLWVQSCWEGQGDTRDVTRAVEVSKGLARKMPLCHSSFLLYSRIVWIKLRKAVPRSSTYYSTLNGVHVKIQLRLCGVFFALFIHLVF